MKNLPPRACWAELFLGVGGSDGADPKPRVRVLFLLTSVTLMASCIHRPLCAKGRAPRPLRPIHAENSNDQKMERGRCVTLPDR